MNSTIKTYDVAIGRVTLPDEKMWHPRFDVCYTFETIEDAKAFQKRMEMREFDDNAKKSLK